MNKPPQQPRETMRHTSHYWMCENGTFEREQSTARKWNYVTLFIAQNQPQITAINTVTRYNKHTPKAHQKVRIK